MKKLTTLILMIISLSLFSVNNSDLPIHTITGFAISTATTPFFINSSGEKGIYEAIATTSLIGLSYQIHKEEFTFEEFACFTIGNLIGAEVGKQIYIGYSENKFNFIWRF